MIIDTEVELDFIKAALPYRNVDEFDYWIAGMIIRGDVTYESPNFLRTTPYTYCAAPCSINDPGFNS